MTSLHVVDDGEETAAYRIRQVVKMLLQGTDTTKAALAAAIGLSYDQLADRLRGDRDFKVNEVQWVADYFRVPVGVLYAGPTALLSGGSVSVSKLTFIGGKRGRSGPPNSGIKNVTPRTPHLFAVA